MTMAAQDWLRQAHHAPRCALRYVVNGTEHMWTTGPGSAAYTARWLAVDAYTHGTERVPVEVLMDWGDGRGWVVESVWTGDPRVDDEANGLVRPMDWESDEWPWWYADGSEAEQ
jgi:hypothetical protein